MISRGLFQPLPFCDSVIHFPPSSVTTKTRYKALLAIDTDEQGLQGETVPAAHSGYCQKKESVLIMHNL